MSPEFLAWFQKSQVIHPNGSPRIVIHGSPSSEISVFDAEYEGNNTGPSDAEHGLGGFYFTEDPEVADTYARTIEVQMANIAFEELGLPHRSNLPSSTSYPCFLKIENPLRSATHVTRALLMKALSAGHDVIIAMMESQKEYVVFHPSRIKSAVGNCGAFNAKDLHICR